MEIKSREGKEERPGLGLKGCNRLVHYIPTTDGASGAGRGTCHKAGIVTRHDWLYFHLLMTTVYTKGSDVCEQSGIHTHLSQLIMVLAENVISQSKRLQRALAW